VITIFCRSLSCDKSLYGLFKGTPSARQTVLRPWPDSCTARGQHKRDCVERSGVPRLGGRGGGGVSPLLGGSLAPRL